MWISRNLSALNRINGKWKFKFRYYRHKWNLHVRIFEKNIYLFMRCIGETVLKDLSLTNTLSSCWFKFQHFLFPSGSKRLTCVLVPCLKPLLANCREQVSWLLFKVEALDDKAHKCRNCQQEWTTSHYHRQTLRSLEFV